MTSVKRARTGWFDAAFNGALVVVGSLNIVVIAVRSTSETPVVRADGASWLLIACLVVWLAPSVFYLRTWAASALNTTLWHRAPLAQFVGLLAAAAGFTAALIQLLALALIGVAHSGVAVTVDPAPGRVTVGQIYQDLLWQAVDAVPGLGLTSSLGWERPVPNPDWPLGVGGTISRLAMLGYVVYTVGFVLRHLDSVLFPRLGQLAEGRRGHRDRVRRTNWPNHHPLRASKHESGQSGHHPERLHAGSRPRHHGLPGRVGRSADRGRTTGDRSAR